MSKLLHMASSSLDLEDDDRSSSSPWLGELQLDSSEMNKLVFNYLLTEGYKDAAEKFRDESGLTLSSTESDSNLDARIAIRSAIHDGKICDAIHLINELVPDLLDDDRYLHFRLLQQQLIELIRASSLDEALLFAQEHLAEKGEENSKCLEETEKSLSLLAFEKPEESPFGHLMQTSHRQQVANEVNVAILKAQGRNGETGLEGLVKMVLWAQDLLDKKRIAYHKMTDVGEAKIQEPKNHRKMFLGALERPRT